MSAACSDAPTASSPPGQPAFATGIDSVSGATLSTEFDDYLPGDTVFITGTGFAADEVVDLVLNEDPQLHPVHAWSATTGETGGFSTIYVVDDLDYGVTFTMVATGRTSGTSVSVVFTDGRVITNIELWDPVTNAWVEAPSFIEVSGGASVTVRITGDTNTSGGGGVTSDDWQSTEWKIRGPAPSNGVVDTDDDCDNGANTTSATIGAQHIFSLNAPAASGTYSLDFRAFRSDNCDGNPSSTATYTDALHVTASAPAAAETSLNVSAASGTFGGTVDLSATLTLTSDAAPISGQTVSFMLNGAPVCGVAPVCPTTDASGVATLTGISLSGFDAGSYPGAIGALFAGVVDVWTTSSGSADLTVNRAPGSITISGPASIVYLQSGPISVDSKTGDGAVNFVATEGAGTVCMVVGDTGVVTMLTGTGTCKVKAELAQGTNHEAATSNELTILAAKATPTFAFDLSTLPAKTYGDSPFSVAAYATTNSTGAISFALAAVDPPCSVDAAGEVTITAAGTCGIAASLAQDVNYLAAGPLNGQFDIAKAALTITIVDDLDVLYSKTVHFGDVVPNALLRYEGFVYLDGPANIGNPAVKWCKLNGSCADIAGVPTAVGSYEAYPFPVITGNYNVTVHRGSLTILAWTLTGFYQPVGEANSVLNNITPSASTVWNTVKGGSPVPLKFNVFAGSTEKISPADIASFKQQKVTCPNGAAPVDPVETDLLTTGATSLRYDLTANQFIQNWATTKVSSETCYRATVTTQDGSTISAFFKLRK